LVEQFPFKEWVDGSSPSGLTIKLYFLEIYFYNYLSTS
jgi:hypothetical protein